MPGRRLSETVISVVVVRQRRGKLKNAPITIYFLNLCTSAHTTETYASGTRAQVHAWSPPQMQIRYPAIPPAIPTARRRPLVSVSGGTCQFRGANRLPPLVPQVRPRCGL